MLSSIIIHTSMVMAPHRRPLQLTHMICPPSLPLSFLQKKKKQVCLYHLEIVPPRFLLLTHRSFSPLFDRKRNRVRVRTIKRSNQRRRRRKRRTLGNRNERNRTRCVFISIYHEVPLYFSYNLPL